VRRRCSRNSSVSPEVARPSRTKSSGSCRPNTPARIESLATVASSPRRRITTCGPGTYGAADRAKDPRPRAAGARDTLSPPDADLRRYTTSSRLPLPRPTGRRVEVRGPSGPCSWVCDPLHRPAPCLCLACVWLPEPRQHVLDGPLVLRALRPQRRNLARKLSPRYTRHPRAAESSHLPCSRSFFHGLPPPRPSPASPLPIIVIFTVGTFVRPRRPRGHLAPRSFSCRCSSFPPPANPDRDRRRSVGVSSRRRRRRLPRGYLALYDAPFRAPLCWGLVPSLTSVAEIGRPRSPLRGPATLTAVGRLVPDLAAGRSAGVLRRARNAPARLPSSSASRRPTPTRAFIFSASSTFTSPDRLSPPTSASGSAPLEKRSYHPVTRDPHRDLESASRHPP